jgi:hypothetical protein
MSKFDLDTITSGKAEPFPEPIWITKKTPIAGYYIQVSLYDSFSEFEYRKRLGYQQSAVGAILAEAEELITKVGWTQGALARDNKSKAIKCSSQLAVSYCILGALHAATAMLGLSQNVFDDACNRVYHTLGFGSNSRYNDAWGSRHSDGERLANWNDDRGRTRAEVVSVLQSAQRH